MDFRVIIVIVAIGARADQERLPFWPAPGGGAEQHGRVGALSCAARLAAHQA